MKAGAKAEVSLYIEAPPEKLYDLISDVSRTGEWSPECRHCEWTDGATGPTVGAWFKGTNKRGFVRWSTKSRVVTAAEGKEFSFVTRFKDHDETRWTYRFDAREGGTLVTETFELLADMASSVVFMERVLLRIKDRKSDLQANMRQTLQRLKETVEGRTAAMPR